MAPKRRITAKPKIKIWSEEEILNILDSCYQELMTNDDAFYLSYLTVQRGLSRKVLYEWVKASPAIDQLYHECTELSEQKIANEMMKSRSKLNTISSIFVLKSSYKWIEAEKNKNLQIQEQQLKMDKTKIKIGFVEDEEDSDGTPDQQ